MQNILTPPRLSTILAPLLIAGALQGATGQALAANNLPATRSHEPPVDLEIKQRIQEAFLRDLWIDRHAMTLEVRDGIAYLSGTVDSPFTKLHAEEIASRVPGVIRVINDLIARAGWSWNQDWETRLAIEHKLWLSARIDMRDIRVTVQDGVATLMGAVDTWQEKQAATVEALKGGAKSVRNELQVRAAGSGESSARAR